MKAPPKIYLAGPEVFLPNALAIGRRKKELCAEHGFEGLYPSDNEIDSEASAEALDRQIYRANVAMIRAADAGIFNLTPFRGPSADVGTVFELGLMTGLGKPAFGYTNDPFSLLERMQRAGDAVFDSATKQWFDRAGQLIENFGNIDNLMIDASLAEQGDGYLLRPEGNATLALDDLSGFIGCLKRASHYFGIDNPSRHRPAR